MFQWSDFRVYLEGSSAYIAFLPLLFGLVYFIYRRTYPEVGRSVRLALVALRCAAVGLLLLLLAEPVLDLWRKQVVRPQFLLLIDTSGSMGTEEKSERRLARVKGILEHEDWQRALESAEVSAWGFAESPYAISLDTLQGLEIGGKATDLSTVVKEGLDGLDEHGNLRGILLFSDGVHNLGADPVATAEEAGTPLYALAVGERESPADIQIVRAEVAGVGYVGQDLRIEAEVRAWGYAGREVEVELHEGETQIGRKSLLLGDDGQNRNLSFVIRPTASGPHIYRLSIAAQEGEFFRDNNETLVFAQVQEERIQVLLIAGAPSPDLAFLRRGLAADSSMAVEVWTQKQEGDTPRQDLETKDVVILLDAGRDLLDGKAGRQIHDQIRQGRGLLFVGGSTSFAEWVPDGPVAQVLPVQMASAQRFVAQETGLRLSPRGRHHPVVRLQVETGGDDPWIQLPPLPGYFPVTDRRQGAITLVEGTGSEQPPLIVAGSAGQGKVIAALSASFWRLDLLTSGAGGRPQTIRQFWRNAVKWLAIQTPVGRVRASTERQIYRSGEQIAFAAQIFDELLRAQDGATVQVTLAQKGVEFKLTEQGGGYYRGHWAGIEPGDYAYTVRAHVGDSPIGEDQGRFIVEPHSIESVDVRANMTLLGEMARVSGGRLRSVEEWREMLDLLPVQKRLVERKEVMPLWDRAWSLVLLALLLTLEWVVRKRCGMI